MAKDPSTHSMRVKLLRRLLIGAAALSALALVGLSNLDRFAGPNMLLDAIRTLGPAVDNPDYQGRTASGRAYRLTGADARADENNNMILRRPLLQLAALADAPAVTINAAEAYLQQGEEAVMQGSVRMDMSDGNQLRTQKLIARLDAETVSIPQPLAITGPQINLTADRLTGNLDSRVFTLDNVSMTLDRQAQ